MSLPDDERIEARPYGGHVAEMTTEGGSWVTRALVDGGAVRLVIVEAAELADEVRRAHALAATDARLAAEATVATILLSAYAKGDEKLSLQIALTQPQARWMGELDPERRYRGRLWTEGGLPAGTDLNDLHGVLQAAKYVAGKEVYRGVTSVEGSITSALRGHLVESTQVNGALATRVHLDDEGHVVRAAGILAERLPEEADQPYLAAEAFLELWGELASEDVEAVLDAVNARTLHGQPVHLLEVQPALWGCTCSQERVLGALAGLGAVELNDMADTDGGAVIHCEFCNARYDISADELRALAEH